MKTNYNPPPLEETDPAILGRVEREVARAKEEYRQRLKRIKEDRLFVIAEQTRDKRTA
jgi:uncharacterized protein (DUF1919 family)